MINCIYSLNRCCIKIRPSANKRRRGLSIINCTTELNQQWFASMQTRKNKEEKFEIELKKIEGNKERFVEIR